MLNLVLIFTRQFFNSFQIPPRPILMDELSLLCSPAPSSIFSPHPTQHAFDKWEGPLYVPRVLTSHILFSPLNSPIVPPSSRGRHRPLSKAKLWPNPLSEPRLFPSTYRSARIPCGSAPSSSELVPRMSCLSVLRSLTSLQASPSKVYPPSNDHLVCLLPVFAKPVTTQWLLHPHPWHFLVSPRNLVSICALWNSLLKVTRDLIKSDGFFSGPFWLLTHHFFPIPTTFLVQVL